MKKIFYNKLVRNRIPELIEAQNESPDYIILDDESSSDTIPTNIVLNNSSFIEHEATVSKISEEKLFYLMSKGLSESAAKDLIILGFISDFKKELPVEYAIELNRLLKNI